MQSTTTCDCYNVLCTSVAPGETYEHTSQQCLCIDRMLWYRKPVSMQAAPMSRSCSILQLRPHLQRQPIPHPLPFHPQKCSGRSLLPSSSASHICLPAQLTGFSEAGLLLKHVVDASPNLLLFHSQETRVSANPNRWGLLCASLFFQGPAQRTHWMQPLLQLHTCMPMFHCKMWTFGHAVGCARGSAAAFQQYGDG